MHRPGWNHLDRRPATAPRPKDYCSNPHAFGHGDDVTFYVPVGGNPIDRDISWLQHELILEWRRRGGTPTTGQLRERYGISKQTFSRVTRGQRFLGERVTMALLLAWQPHMPGSGPV